MPFQPRPWYFPICSIVDLDVPCCLGPVPKSQVPSHLRSICTISTVESMEVGTYHFTRDLMFQVPTTTWMPSWQHFLEVRLGTWVASWVKQ